MSKTHLLSQAQEYTGRDSLLMSLGEVLKGSRRVAMEYSPMGARLASPVWTPGPSIW